MSYGRN